MGYIGVCVCVLSKVSVAFLCVSLLIVGTSFYSAIEFFFKRVGFKDNVYVW